MNIKQFLFSWEGRISRSNIWLKYFVPYFIITIILSTLDNLLGFIIQSNGQPIPVLTTVFTLLFIYPSIIISIKRCHDRNRSGWFLLLSIIPLVNIWILIELYFLKGTLGNNKYGSDPLVKL